MSNPDKAGWVRQASSLGWTKRYMALKDGVLCIYNVSLKGAHFGSPVPLVPWVAFHPAPHLHPIFISQSFDDYKGETPAETIQTMLVNVKVGGSGRKAKNNQFKLITNLKAFELAGSSRVRDACCWGICSSQCSQGRSRGGLICTHSRTSPLSIVGGRHELGPSHLRQHRCVPQPGQV
jgi:hypothetical protein